MSTRYKGGFISSTDATTSTAQAKGIWTLDDVAVARKANAWPLVQTADPFFNNTTLLLNGDGTNGAQNNTFTDSSSNSFTITRTGTPTQGSLTPFSPAGWSGYFNGSTSVVSVTTPGTAFTFGTGDFTIECWINVASVQAGYKPIWSNRGMDAVSVFFALNNATTQLLYYRAGNQILDATALALNTWYHVALVRSGSTVTMYKNGVSVGSVTDTTNLTGTTSYIGQESNGASTYLNASISNLRIVKGTAVYTANFAVPTAPLTAITGTSLLTLQDNRFKDNSSNNFALTVASSTTIQPFSPFAPTAAYTPATHGGSGSFSSANYLNNTSAAVVDFGTGDFTVEYFAYYQSYPTSGQPALAVGTSATSAGMSFGIYSDGKLDATTSTVPYISTGSAVGLNQWRHVAFVRSGTSLRYYLDGVLDYTATVSTSFNETGFGVGSSKTGTFPTTGFLSNLRVVKGVAVYSGTSTTTPNFVVPTGPLSATQSANPFGGSNTAAISSGTSLLLNFTNAGIVDATSKNDVITTLDAKISTATSKWGTGSIVFDGIGDNLTIIDSPTNRLGSGDFTLEGWINLAALGSIRGIVSKGTSTTGWGVSVNALNQLVFSYGSNTLTGTTMLGMSTWYYFAVVRSGTATGNVKIYSGTSGATTLEATSGTAITTDFNGTDVMYVGADRTGANVLNGYIDDLRITRFARTVTSVPTSAFSVQ